MTNLINIKFPTSGSEVIYKKRTVSNIYKKYGEEFLSLLNKFNNGEYSITLSLIAKKYGLSREWVRQIFTLLYGKRARQIKKVKPKDFFTCVNDPRHKIAEHKKTSKSYRGALKEKEFFEECIKRGYDCTPECASCIDFNVNGFLVEVKSRTKTNSVQGSKTNIAMFTIREIQYIYADFFACWHPDLNCWFIIPKKSIKTKSHQICISNGSRYKTAKNKYHEFKNAWHLIEYKNG